MRPFNLTTYDWIPKVFKEPLYLGMDTIGSGYDRNDRSFFGSISCLQIFDYALDPAAMLLKKNCQDLPEEFRQPPCPLDYELYDGTCYKVSSVPATFAEAEMVCLPSPQSPYQSQLAYIGQVSH